MLFVLAVFLLDSRSRGRDVKDDCQLYPDSPGHTCSCVLCTASASNEYPECDQVHRQFYPGNVYDMAVATYFGGSTFEQVIVVTANESIGIDARCFILISQFVCSVLIPAVGLMNYYFHITWVTLAVIVYLCI